MKKLILSFFCGAVILATACKDHDDPELWPIDTSEVKITADISVTPSVSWMTPSEELTVRVANVEMTAPKGTVIRNINIMVNDWRVQQKPFSGETLEFKLPLNQVRPGRLNIAVYAELIRKDCRDAEIIIADNLQRIVFSEIPEFDCESTADITVTSKSTSGEEYNHSFQAKSSDHFTITVPKSEIYWTPKEGTASTLDLTLTASAESFSTNSTLESYVERAYWGAEYGASPTIKISIPNRPGALNDKKLMMIVNTTRSGTWENVSISNNKMTYTFDVIETE